MTHTPGPWRQHRDWVIGGPDDDDICRFGDPYSEGPTTPHDDENMALVIAAPDMLAALRAVLCILAEGPLLEQVQAAIAKAEGGPQ